MRTKESILLEEAVEQQMQAAIMAYEAALQMKKVVDRVTERIMSYRPKPVKPATDLPCIEFGFVDFESRTIKVIKS